MGWHHSHANLVVHGAFKLMGVLGLNTDFNWSFKAFAFAVSVRRVWPSFLKGAMPLESCLECLSSE